MMPPPQDPLGTFVDMFSAEWRQVLLRRGASPDDVRHPGYLCGLALSGGGIRSATFCLGVLQRLSKSASLGLFDYLSTISGGGFIGGWWSAWLSRQPRGQQFPSPEHVLLDGDTLGEVGPEGARHADRDPVRHLRLFSNYLTPRKGALSKDTWRAVTVVSRNLCITAGTLLLILWGVLLVFQLPFLVTGRVADDFTRLLPTAALVCPATASTSSAYPDALRARAELLALWIAPFAGALVLLTIAWWLASLLPPGSQEVWTNRMTRGQGALLVVTVVLTLGLALSGWSLDLVEYLFASCPGHPVYDAVRKAGGWAAVLASLAGVAFTAFRKSPTGGADKRAGLDSTLEKAAFAIIPILVILVLSVVLSASARLVLGALVGRGYDGAVTCLALAVLVTVAVFVLGWRTNPNLLSLHTFYRARLVRAYLGASNETRLRNRSEITESAPGDDWPLSSLSNCARCAPYHLVGTTLNLAGGRDLATAQRLGDYFVLSPLYCGSERTGYRQTEAYMHGGLSLGTAMGISGAAASPNMGAKGVSGAQAMLLALMNVRLGFWAPNPGRPSWQARAPKLWPWHLLLECLSVTTDTARYCYLSDGGHFDNTGLYPLVQRGCRLIVVIDCGADPEVCFADLGDAIRRCRIDFRADINLDIDQLRPLAHSKLSPRHCVVGTLRYARDHLDAIGDPLRDRPQGHLIWIKPSLAYGDPADVRQYGFENTPFPQQTTADQWFSEQQFESYRKLGEKCADAALAHPDVVAALAEAAAFVGP
jgi:hypothetical protein